MSWNQVRIFGFGVMYFCILVDSLPSVIDSDQNERDTENTLFSYAALNGTQ